MRSQWGGECYVAGNDTASRGVAILFGNNFQYKVRNVRKDEIGRYILLDIEMFNKRITLVNIYAPSSGDNPEFFNNVFQQILQMDNEDIIIGGDWNVALNPIIDTNQPSKVYRQRSREQIIKFMSEHDMIDIYRCIHPEVRKYSWQRFNSTQSRIDYFLISEDLGLSIHGADITPGYRSDHSMLSVSIKLTMT